MLGFGQGGAIWVSRRLYARRSGRTFIGTRALATAVLAVSFALLLLSFFILRGFQYQVAAQLYGAVGHIHIMRYALSDANQSAALPLTDPFYRRFEKAPSDTIAFVQGVRYQAALIKGTQSGVAGVLLKGVHRPYDTHLFQLQQGRNLRARPNAPSPECLLSQRMARRLKKAVGDTLIVHVLTQPPRFRQLVIVGLFKTNIEELDTRIVITDLKLINRLDGWENNATQWEVFLHNPDQSQSLLPWIQSQLPYEYYAQTTQERYAGLFEWLSLLNRNLYILLVLIFMVVTFNVAALLILLVRARTYTIGVLKALGAPFAWIKQVFLYQASRMIAIGLLCGNAMAFGLGLLQQKTGLITLDATGYALEAVPIRWLASDLYLLNLSFVVVLYMVALWPLHKQLQMPLIKALNAK